MEYLAVVAVLYFIPWIVALKRRHPQTLAIFALNLLLGWTLIGWAGALVWALTRADRVRVETAPEVRHRY